MCRRGDASENPEASQSRWRDELRPEEWRRILLECLNREPDSSPDKEAHGIYSRSMEDSFASFSDGVNTGFYINAYTTKQCPTMDVVLEEMRMGLE